MVFLDRIAPSLRFEGLWMVEFRGNAWWMVILNRNRSKDPIRSLRISLDISDGHET